MTNEDLVKERVWSQFSGGLISTVVDIMVGWKFEELHVESIVIPKDISFLEFPIAVNACTELKELPKELIPTALSYLPFYLSEHPQDAKSPYLSLD